MKLPIDVVTYAGWYLLYATASLFLLWVFYLAVMRLWAQKRQSGLNLPSKVLGYPVLFIGYLLDANANVFVMSVVLLELPRETTVTARLRRHMKGTGWRRTVSTWFEPILDPYDPTGNHI